MLYPGIRLTTEGKDTEKNSQGSQQVPVVHDCLSRYAHLLRGSLDKSVDPGFS